MSHLNPRLPSRLLRMNLGFRAPISSILNPNHPGWRQSSLSRIRFLPLHRHPRLNPLRHFSSQPSWPSPIPSRHLPSPPSRVTRDGYTHFGRRPSPSSPVFRYLVAASSVGLGVYIYSSIDYAPFTGRRRIMGMSRSQELAVGASAYQNMLEQCAGRILPLHHPETQRVRKVVARIASTVRRLDSSLSDGFEWQVVVIVDNEPNAMCFPGGKMLITTGLLEILPSSDDIAVVLGHEISHALNRHGAETMHLQRMLVPLLLLMNQLFDMRWVSSMLVSLTLSLPYSRKLEYEADEVGLHLCTEACFNPSVAPGVFKRLGDLENRRAGGILNNVVAPFLSTHPQSKERAKRLEKAVPECLRRYHDRCVASSSFSRGVGDFAGHRLSHF